jgi:hypothetical protein
MLERERTMEKNVTGKFGIYVNAKDLKVTRINSPYWIPSGPDWTFLTTEVNMTMFRIRQLAKERKLVSEPDKLVWN